MPFGTRDGHGVWMKPISYKQETGEIERLLCPGAPQGPVQFHEVLYITIFLSSSTGTKIPTKWKMLTI